jgi:hypothetical protein
VGVLGAMAHNVNWAVTAAYFAWAGVAFVRYLLKPSSAVAFHRFGNVWRQHISKAS